MTREVQVPISGIPGVYDLTRVKESEWDPEGKGFAEVTGRDTGRTAHGKPKCRQGHAIFGSRVAPPEREEERRCFAGLNWTVTSRRGYSNLSYGGADGEPGEAGTTRSNTRRKKKEQ
jgi:hypothetical protein